MKIYNKYKIEHTDGTPLKGKKYFVLRLDSDDPIEAARVARAMRAYEGKLRNCDVGTAKEQNRRFERYCDSEVCECKMCKNVSKYLVKSFCALAWAQRPYEEEGAAK